MSVFAEEKGLTLQFTQNRPRKARKLIPRNSKVFPKDFFLANCELNTEPNASPLSVATPKHSPLDSTGHLSNIAMSPFSSGSTPQRVFDQMNYWRANKDSSSKLKSYLSMNRPVQSEHKVFKDITNFSYENKSLSDAQEILLSNRGVVSEAPVKVGLSRRRYMQDKENIFFSITESDENNCQQLSPRGQLRRADTEEQIQEEMQRTPIFKCQENLPSIKREVRSKKLVFEQDKWNGQGHHGVTQSVSNLVLPLPLPMNHNPFKDMNMPAPMRHQRGHRRSDLIGLNVKIELINNQVCNEKRGFLPSLIKS